MLPLDLLAEPRVVTTLVDGFVFMVGFYGLPFVMSLYLQQHARFSPLHTGLIFLPMMLSG